MKRIPFLDFCAVTRVSVPAARLHALLLLICASLLGTGLLGCADLEIAPRAQGGQIDLTDWDFGRGSVDLQGDWSVCWGQLLEPGETCPTAWSNVGVRGLWSDESARSPFGGKGVATYRLRVGLPRKGEPEFALSAGVPMTAYRLWINGHDRGGAGRVGKDAASTSSEPRRNRVFSLDRGEHEVDLWVQLANFEFRGGGIRRPWVIGHATSIQRLSGASTLRDALLATISALVGIASLIQFFLRRSEISRAYFGAFALVMAGRMIPGSISDLAQLIVPWASFSQLLRFEYLGTALALVTGLGYIAAKFPSLLPPRLVGAMQLLSLSVAPIVLLAPFDIVLAILPFFLVMPPLAGGLVILVCARAWWRGATEVRVTLLASLIFLASIVHDVIRASITSFGLAIELFPYFFVVWISVEAYELASKFTQSFQREEARSEELDDLNFELQETEAAFVRFTPLDLLTLLRKSSVNEIEAGDHVCEVMSVLHCKLGEHLLLGDDKDVMRRVNDLTKRVAFHARAYGGFVSEQRGGGIQAVFAGGADSAMKAARAILDGLSNDTDELRDLSIGIDTGPLLVGVLGDESQLIGSTIGPAEARAERLARLAHRTPGRLLVSAETRSAWRADSALHSQSQPFEEAGTDPEIGEVYTLQATD